MPKLDVSRWTEHAGAVNRLSGQNDGPFSELVLGEQERLTQFGVRLERLPPGSRSSHRHWHETEDEFAYVLAGELVLVEDQETVLRAGDAAAWAAGDALAHCLENRSSEDAVYLVIGARAHSGVVHYPDHGIVLHHEGEVRRFTRTDGSPIEP
ncbi:cupin domain-containing protein [Roseateles violae]|uniref:Cupin domain-containing protein n=1 Tax=Roseateles violae TaxID=3058042 RepID=A0ABT8DM01_9BURK|nr:cupin domain-containing protein [Pelomonas sp. PFR6]MDN3919436.1 cupin domain-containing protein [Pelomonas sp. PFR6]